MSEPSHDSEKVRAIVEAILMTADAPVNPGRLQSLLKGSNGRDIRQAVDELNERYHAGGHAMSIVEVAGGFLVATRREYGPWVRKFHDRGQVRLSQAALETLAIVAFKQPITRVEIDSIRGVDSGGVIRTLLELSMLRIVGRSEGVGRPMLFGTTREFMTHFGLKSLADLPKPKELEELLAEGERQHRAASGEAPEGLLAEDEADGTVGAGDGTDDDILGVAAADDTGGDGSGGSDVWGDEAAPPAGGDLTAVLGETPEPDTEPGSSEDTDGEGEGEPAEAGGPDDEPAATS
ncbi:MAG: SMC-Scp complex subunit ScpB [Gemmatimonadota bacterium]